MLYDLSNWIDWLCPDKMENFWSLVKYIWFIFEWVPKYNLSYFKRAWDTIETIARDWKHSFEKELWTTNRMWGRVVLLLCLVLLPMSSYDSESRISRSVFKLFTDTIKRDFALHGDPSGRLSLKWKVDLCRVKLPIRKIGDWLWDSAAGLRSRGRFHWIWFWAKGLNAHDGSGYT